MGEKGTKNDEWQDSFASADKGVSLPRVQNLKYSFDEKNRWVFETPSDVKGYLESQFGGGIRIAPLGDESQNFEYGYGGYYVERDREIEDVLLHWRGG